MGEAALENVLKRDRMVVAAALVTLTALAWTYLLGLALSGGATAPSSSMPGMDMAAMNMAASAGPSRMVEFLFTFAMWVVMMIGMMTPSAAPMILIYARVGRQAREEGKLFAATGWFAGGYLLAWTAFAVVASLVQEALSAAALITPMLALGSGLSAAPVLIAAGLYQWSPLKQSCLSQCRAPLGFLTRHGGFRRDPNGALNLGLKHGLYCIGCCWALMLLLFVAGVMNAAWIAALSILVLLEKILPFGRFMPRAVGLVLIAAGTIFVVRTAM
jgi:predicted metal-binding membrane protein